MRVHGRGSVVVAAGASRIRPVALSAYVTGFVAVFVLAAGAGLGGLFAAGQLSGDLAGPAGPEFIEKPFTPQDLLDKVHAMLAAC